MSSSNGLSTALTVGAVALGGYWLYENFFAAPAATAVSTAPASTPVGGGTSPATPVSTTVTTGGAPTTVTPPPPPPVVEPPPSQTSRGGGPPAPSLAALYSNILGGASTDPNFTGAGDSLSSSAYRWGTYLNIALEPSGIPAPALSTAFPGVDLSQPMTAAQFWAGMGPALTAQSGLSGFFAGLGAYHAMRGGLGDDTPVLQDSLTVTPSTAGQGYNIDPTTGAVTVIPAAGGISTTTILAVAGVALVGVLLMAGRR